MIPGTIPQKNRQRSVGKAAQQAPQQQYSQKPKQIPKSHYQQPKIPVGRYNKDSKEKGQQQQNGKNVENVYEQFQDLQDKQSKEKELPTFDADELERYYAQMNINGNNKNSQAQQPQGNNDVEDELEALQREQDMLREQIYQQQNQNQAYEDLIRDAQYQKDSQQHGKPPVPQSYGYGQHQEMNQQPGTQEGERRSSVRGYQQQQTSQHVLYGQQQIQQQKDDQQEVYHHGSGKKYERIEPGLIGTHKQDGENNSITGRKINYQQYKGNNSTGIFGGEYNYFKDENRLQISQKKNGTINQVNPEFDRIQAFQHAQQQQQIRNQKYKSTNLW